jgi:DnaJ-class molecular chaperone
MFTQRAVKCLPCKSTGRFNALSCIKCQGRGRISEACEVKVQIPPGWNREEIRLARAGDHGKSDLVVQVNVDEHLTYKRIGSDLFIMEHLSLAETLSGYTQVVTHVSGHRLIKVHYPHPIFSDCKLVAENLGLPKSSSPDGSLTFGNMIIDLKVTFPDSVPIGAVPQIKAAISDP